MRCALAAVTLLCATGVPAPAQVRDFAVVGDTIPESLTGSPGDPARGRAIVANRHVGLCLL